MTELNSEKIFSSKETLRDIILLTIWSGVLFLCALTLKSYYIAGQPPLWDNLSYQKQALQFLTNGLEGNWIESLNEVWDLIYPAYIISLAISFLLFGLNPVSPYIVSAFFGTACIVVVYLLSKELGANKRIAFWGVIFFSLLPTFFYQNFLQTRNDFPLAFFITLSWVFLLQGIKRKDIKLAFFAGATAGIGTLFKASAPGYVAWGILALSFLPEKYIQTNFKDRMKLGLLFLGGAVFSCGWHYLPHLDETLSYYSSWGNRNPWVISQYNLQLNWTDYFFYVRNIIFLHLGEKISLGITIISGILLIRWSIIKRSINLTEKQSKELPLILLVLTAGILPIIFISLTQSLSTLGDTPILPLIAAGSLAFVGRISYGIVIPKVFLISLLLVCLILSLTNSSLLFPTYPDQVKDIEKLSHSTLEIRKEFGLGKTPMLQIFSHPIYNADTLAWLWMINPKIDRNLVPSNITQKTQLAFPENSEGIALKLKKRYALILLSEFSGTTIQGETFATLNRLHSKINSQVYKQGQFLKLRSLDLAGGRFPIHFMLNKNFSALHSTQARTDNLTKWGGEIQ